MGAKVLERYVSAFDRQDIATLAALLRDDIEYQMPPITAWFRGREQVLDHLARRALSVPSRSVRTSANGQPAAAIYHPDGGGVFRPHGLTVLTTSGSLISHVTVFLDPGIFPAFGLRPSLPPD